MRPAHIILHDCNNPNGRVVILLPILMSRRRLSYYHFDSKDPRNVWCATPGSRMGCDSAVTMSQRYSPHDPCDSRRAPYQCCPLMSTWRFAAVLLYPLWHFSINLEYGNVAQFLCSWHFYWLPHQNATQTSLRGLYANHIRPSRPLDHECHTALSPPAWIYCFGIAVTCYTCCSWEFDGGLKIRHDNTSTEWLRQMSHAPIAPSNSLTVLSLGWISCSSRFLVRFAKNQNFQSFAFENQFWQNRTVWVKRS